MRLSTVILGFYAAATTSAQFFYAANASASGAWTNSNKSAEEGVYLISKNGEDASVTFDTSQISEDGNYSVILYTPGCQQDDTCDQRGTISVEGHYATKPAPGVPTATLIAQTNNFDKYDEIYSGGVNASNGDFRSSVKLSSASNSTGIIVAQKIRFVLRAVFSNQDSSATGTIPTQTSGAAPTTPNTVVTVTASPNAGSGGLDKGAKIGIGVGVALAVLISLLVAAVLIYQRRKHRAAATGSPDQNDGGRAAVTAADDDEVEKLSQTQAQLHGESSHQEMQGDSAQAELAEGSLHTRAELLGGLAHVEELPARSPVVVEKELPDLPRS